MGEARLSEMHSSPSTTTKRTYAGELHEGRPGPHTTDGKGFFEADPEAVSAARHFVRAFLDGDGRAADAELVVSELATNAVRHAGSPFTVTLALCDRLRIEVGDKLEVLPTPTAPSPDATGGRGLQIVEAVAHAWGARLDPGGGKVVWVELGDADA